MLKNNFFSYISFVFIIMNLTNDTYAINCQGDNPDEMTSLRNPGGSLDNMTLQDQDGLGTCYANALALALEAKTGRNFSYQQLAIIYGMNNNANDERSGAVTERTSNLYNPVAENFVEGGWSCEAFNEAKQRPFLCSRSAVPIENLETPRGQEKIMDALSDFYDSYGSVTTNDQETFKNTMIELLGGAQTRHQAYCDNPLQSSTEENLPAPGMERFLKQKCLEYNDRVDTANEAITFTESRIQTFRDQARDQAIDDWWQEQGETGNSPDDATIKSRLEDILSEDPFYIGLEESIETMSNTVNEFQMKIAQIGTISNPDDSDLSDLDSTKKNNASQASCDLHDNIKSATRDHYFNILRKQFSPRGNSTERNSEGQIRPAINSFLSNSFSSSISQEEGDTDGSGWPESLFYDRSGDPLDEDTLQEIFLEDIALVVPSECIDARNLQQITDRENIITIFENEAGMCISQELGNSIVGLIENLGFLSNSAFPRIDDLRRIVTNLDENLEGFFMGTIGQQCLNGQGRIGHEVYGEFNCQNTSFPFELIKPAILSQDELRRREEEAIKRYLEREHIEEILKRHVEVNADGTLIINANENEHKKLLEEAKLEKNKKKLRGKVSETLANDNGVMIDVCTSFFHNANATSNYGNNCNVAEEQHGYHAMVVIGTRCNNGVVEYQVQNSWGEGCGNFSNNNYPGSGSGNNQPQILYDCDSEGGFFWVPETTLVNNLRSIQRLVDSKDQSSQSSEILE